MRLPVEPFDRAGLVLATSTTVALTVVRPKQERP
jgi:hypothetical protein